MNLLAIDASSQNISLAISYKNKLLVDFNRKIKFGASKLIAYLDGFLRQFSLNLNNFDALVIGKGPGSFTGLRISFSVVKGLVAARQKPAIAVSSFFSCAYPLRDKSKNITVVADARRNQIYCASFTAENGRLKKNGSEKLLAVNQLTGEKASLWATYEPDLRQKILDGYPQINFYPREVYPKAKYLLPLAEIYYQKGKFTPINKLEPLYLRPKTCQIRL